MTLRRIGSRVRLWCAVAWLAAGSFAAASEYHGAVTLGGLPVPGVTVTATQGDKKMVAVTDTQGVYSFPNLADGSWAVKVEMTGFAPLKQDVAVTPSTPAGKWEIKMLTLGEIRTEDKPVKVDPTVAPAAVVAAAPSAVKGAGGKAAAAKGAAVAAGSAPAPAAEESAPKANDGFLINGSVNNAATSQFALSQAFGNSRNTGKGLYNGSLGMILDNSALDAKPFSLTGLDTAKPAYNRLTFVATFGGPIKIPRLMPRGPNFFIAYQWTRNRNDTTASALVPDAAERSGNLSELGVQLYNPTTGAPYVNNMVPVSPQAQALLNFYPLPSPGLAGTTGYNYQVPLASETHSDSMQSRLDKSISPRNQVFGGFNFQSSRSSSPSIFGFVDTTDNLGINMPINWSHRFKQRLFVTAGYNFSRYRNKTIPYFENRENVSSLAGIDGNLQDPADWGPPSLSFSSGIAGLSDQQSADNRNETNAGSLNVYWNKLRHNLTFGGDLRRLEFNYFTEQNPRGTFTFTGAATEGLAGSTAAVGSDLADFLLGVPDASAIAYGNADKYLRQNVYDAFVTDDWRIRPELTINVGLRWEYGAPITELKNRLVNLDVASGFTAVAPVLASAPTGGLTGQSYPTSLIRPDRLGIEPRLGLSWRPISGSSVVVRAGYGVYDDTSVYQATALAMAQQAPLSTSYSVSNSAACRFTLGNAFTLPCASASADTFAVDPNFRVGYAQTWRLEVQRDLPRSLQMTVSYLGIKGTRGVQQFLPNTAPIGAANACTACPSDFTYRSSNGDSTRESGTVQVRRRLRNGLTANLQYTFSKSLDDDSVLGGQGPVAVGAAGQSTSAAGIAQNWLNLRGERGLSTFDQRHLLNAQVQYTTGMGIGGRTLMSGWKGAIYKEWTVLTNISYGSGTPETPIYLEAISGTGFTNILRPNVTGTSVYAPAAGLFLDQAAYVAPPSGQWGDARRDSITGPNQFTLNGSMSRTFRLHDRYNLDIRFDSTNPLNHVVYSSWVTTVNSSQFGLPAGTGAMRSFVVNVRMRY